MTRCVLLLLVSACAGPVASRPPAGSEAPVVTIPKPGGETTDAPAEPGSRQAGEKLAGTCEKDESPGAAERASERFAEGRALLDEKRYADALRVFRASYEATCAINLLFIVGAMLERLDDLDGSVRTLREYERANTSEIGRRRVRSYLGCIERRRHSTTPIDCLAEERAMPNP